MFIVSKNEYPHSLVSARRLDIVKTFESLEAKPSACWDAFTEIRIRNNILCQQSRRFVLAASICSAIDEMIGTRVHNSVFGSALNGAVASGDNLIEAIGHVCSTAFPQLAAVVAHLVCSRIVEHLSARGDGKKPMKFRADEDLRCCERAERLYGKTHGYGVSWLTCCLNYDVSQDPA